MLMIQHYFPDTKATNNRYKFQICRDCWWQYSYKLTKKRYLFITYYILQFYINIYYLLVSNEGEFSILDIEMTCNKWHFQNNISCLSKLVPNQIARSNFTNRLKTVKVSTLENKFFEVINLIFTFRSNVNFDQHYIKKIK